MENKEKEFDVSFEIQTTQHSLEELSGLVNYHSSRSFDKGVNGHKLTKWCLDSNLPKVVDLENHLDWIKRTVNEIKLLEVDWLSMGYELFVNVAVYYSSINCTVLIPPSYAKWMGDNKIVLVINTYPED